MNSDMEKSEALAFLRQHQPMPPSDEVTPELRQRYHAVREYFTAHPDPECILLFLSSFGEGNFSMYQLVDEVMWQFTPDQVLPYLKESLRSVSLSIRYWSAEIAVLFPSSEILEPLKELLFGADLDCRFAAAMALEYMPDERTDDVLLKAREQEQDTELRQLLTEIVERR
jgi:hypothetical protein